jgi:hypothetical protein
MMVGWAVGAEAGALALDVASTSRGPEEMLAADAAAWAAAPQTELFLQRTPPIYESDPLDDGYRPSAHAAAVRNGDRLWVRLRWTDPTDSEPLPPARLPDAGDPRIYREHSVDVERFADAACVMVPREPGMRGAYPALMMGDTGDPVNLFYWNRRRGFERMTAAGRATVPGSGPAFPGTARRLGDAWEVVFELPALPAGTPIAFAVWDGDRGQRSGLKYYSLWYEVAP